MPIKKGSNYWRACTFTRKQAFSSAQVCHSFKKTSSDPMLMQNYLASRLKWIQKLILSNNNLLNNDEAKA
ncbi:MAG: hypothetical protein WBZ42_08410, partial [Halobacteriota archaeon]